MNIFEDFIDELKEDNLLEGNFTKTASGEFNSTVLGESVSTNIHSSVDKTEEGIFNPIENEVPTDFISTAPEDFETISPEIINAEVPNTIDFETNQTVPDNKSFNEAEFYRKRAINEVSFLQMVERVFGGLEREQMKIVPKPIDDLEVKKVLHAFLQVSKEANLSEQAQAEFQLLQETESWFSALTHRDKRISINHLRRYCESTRPPLSSPALISLARFYRNSPYSEQARGKFDFVITRLFAKDIADERREMVFSRGELITHLNELYAEWSSIPLYSTDEDDAELLLIALKFEDFITESAVAGSFDELIKNDFFNRLRLFKKSTNENFFSPQIVAAGIESNIKIGNRYVELLEKEKGNKAVFEDKYGFLHDQTISDATGKTFQLVELLSRKADKPKPVESAPKTERRQKPAQITKTEVKLVQDKKEDKTIGENKKVIEKPKPVTYSPPKPAKNERSSLFSVNKWLLTATIFTIIASFGLYFWANSSDSLASEAANVKSVNLSNSSLKEYIQSARISEESFFAITLPSWDNLSPAKREDLLKKILSLGGEKGFKKVMLLNSTGKTVGFASPARVETY